MAVFIFTHALGCMALDEKGKVLGESLFSGGESSEEKKKFLDAHPGSIEVQALHQPHLAHSALSHLRKSFDRVLLRNLNMALTKEAVKRSTTEDILLIQAVKMIDDLDRVSNTLVHRLRDWYELYFPEYSARETDNRSFVEGIRLQDKEDYLRKNSITSFGADIGDAHISMLKKNAEMALGLYSHRDALLGYIEHTMKALCPNILAVAGGFLGGKLLEHAGSLKRLASMPSSTIQTLGAEKALFRHLRTGSRPPKHGVLLSHALVQTAPKERQGKAARVLADKLSIAARIDYFKGGFMGDALLEQARKKLA